MKLFSHISAFVANASRVNVGARAILSFVLLIAGTLPAVAGSLVYTTSTNWQASSPGGSATLDFESSNAGYYNSFVYSPYTFTAGTGAEWIQNNAAAGTGSGHYLTTDISSILNIALGTGVYGVAFKLGSNSGSPAPATIVATDVNGLLYTTSGFTTSGPSGPAAF